MAEPVLRRSSRNRRSPNFFVPPYTREVRRVNWRKLNVLTPALNQGLCGCCWAFTAAELIECKNAIQSNTAPVALSPQHLIDCCNDNGNCQGCLGGFVSGALHFVEHDGIFREESYPYVSEEDLPTVPRRQCRAASLLLQGHLPFTRIQGVKVERFIDLKRMNKLLMMTPVAIMIDPYRLHLDYKKKDIWTSHRLVKRANVKHAVLVSGIGITADVVWFEAKNSWGQRWGDDGYFRIKAGDCGMFIVLILPGVLITQLRI